MSYEKTREVDIKKMGNSSLRMNEKELISTKGGGYWYWSAESGEWTYMLDEITVTGTQGTSCTPSDIWETSEVYETLAVVSGVALSSYNLAFSVIGMLYSYIEGLYEDFNQELYQQGYSSDDELHVVSSMQVMGNGEVVEIEKYYNSNGDLIKTLTIPR